jgi:hypothetical protein
MSSRLSFNLRQNPGYSNYSHKHNNQPLMFFYRRAFSLRFHELEFATRTCLKSALPSNLQRKCLL